MRKHLEGVRIIDLTAYLSGPYVSMNLAAMGAEVIKIERPKIGDPCRWNPPFAGPEGITRTKKSDSDVSALYLKRNRGKKSVFLDLRHEKGKDIFRRLVETGDVVVENFAVGAMDRLGFGYEALREINPKIIYCSISGYGQDGPYKNRTAFDLTVQATSGIMGVTGFPDGPPTRCGAWVGDMIPAMYGLSGILAALYSREKTGRGERLDISMQDACFSMIMDEALDLHLEWGVPMRTGNRNPRLAPWNTYQARDGYVIICVAANPQWQAFLEAIDRLDLADDDKYATPEGRFKNSDEIEEIVKAWLAPLSKAEALERLRAKKVPCDEVPEIADILQDPHLQHRGMIHELRHPLHGGTGVKTAGFPIRFTDTEAGLDVSAPFPGQHGDEVYAELLGLSGEELSKLREEGII